MLLSSVHLNTSRPFEFSSLVTSDAVTLDDDSCNMDEKCELMDVAPGGVCAETKLMSLNVRGTDPGV